MHQEDNFVPQANNNATPQNNVDEFSLVKSTADKIRKKQASLPEAERKLEEFNKNKQEFLKFFEPPFTKYIPIGGIAILAVIFDFILSNQTLQPLTQAEHIQNFTRLIALMFNLIDVGLAILASGILAHDLIGKVKAKKVWQPILWAFCAVKITLFVIFSTLKNSNGSISYTGMAIIVVLVILVYLILDFGGAGLAYFIGQAKFAIQKNIFMEEPVKIQRDLQELCHNLTTECSKYKFSISDVREHFRITNICQN